MQTVRSLIVNSFHSGPNFAHSGWSVATSWNRRRKNISLALYSNAMIGEERYGKKKNLTTGATFIQIRRRRRQLSVVLFLASSRCCRFCQCRSLCWFWSKRVQMTLFWKKQSMICKWRWTWRKRFEMKHPTTWRRLRMRFILLWNHTGRITAFSSITWSDQAK